MARFFSLNSLFLNLMEQFWHSFQQPLHVVCTHGPIDPTDSFSALNVFTFSPLHVAKAWWSCPSKAFSGAESWKEFTKIWSMKSPWPRKLRISLLSPSSPNFTWLCQNLHMMITIEDFIFTWSSHWKICGHSNQFPKFPHFYKFTRIKQTTWVMMFIRFLRWSIYYEHNFSLGKKGIIPIRLLMYCLVFLR